MSVEWSKWGGARKILAEIYQPLDLNAPPTIDECNLGRQERIRAIFDQLGGAQ